MKHIALWHIRWDKPALVLYSVCFCVSLVSVGFGPQVVKLALINQTNKQTQTGCVISDEARWLLYKKKDASVASTNFFASPAAFRSDPNSNEEVGAQSFVQNFYVTYMLLKRLMYVQMGSKDRIKTCLTPCPPPPRQIQIQMLVEHRFNANWMKWTIQI